VAIVSLFLYVFEPLLIDWGIEDIIRIFVEFQSFCFEKLRIVGFDSEWLDEELVG